MTNINFRGKEFVFNHHLSVPFHILEPQPDLGVGEPSLEGNLVIHGDNLLALKALLPRYSNLVDCVFIDPPYNTGNESWCYNDNVNSPMMNEWLGNVVGIDDGLRHDKWCAMMYPRLRLLSELIKPGGLICVTIDNNEVHRLWMLLDEIFGGANLVGCAPWLSEASGGKEKTGLRTGHEYLVIFSKGETEITQDVTIIGDLNQEDEWGPYQKGRELNKWGGTSERADRPGQWFSLTAPDSTEVWPIKNDGSDGHWRWGPNNPEMLAIMENPERVVWEKRDFDDGVTWNGQNWRWSPYEKLRITERSVGWKSWLGNLAYNADGTRELKQLFGTKVFDTPKPVKLIEWIVGLVEDDHAIFLDSFAGSGTTAHAILNANQLDRGDRRFLLVEMEDYANEITAERIRRVVNGYEYTGKINVELHRENITWSKIRNNEQLLARITSARQEHSEDYEQISVELKNDQLIVNGEQSTDTHQIEGLGGEFTFCTLSQPVEIEAILSGEELPEYTQLGAILFQFCTNTSLDFESTIADNYYLGESSTHHVWMLYQNDLDWLKSSEGALTLARAREFAEYDQEKRHLVIAPAKYVSQKMLEENNILVEFVPLPYTLFSV